MLSFLSENMVVLTLTCLAVVILLVIIFLMKVAIKHGKQGANSATLASTTFVSANLS